VGTPPTRRA